MTNSAFSRSNSESGLTLIEVLLASMLLALALIPLFGGLTNCLRIMQASRRFQQVQWVFGLGSIEHPVTDVEDLDDLAVDPDTELCEGYTFERKIDEKTVDNEETDDGLYVMRTRVSWGAGGDGEYEERVQYIWKKGAGDYP